MHAAQNRRRSCICWAPSVLCRPFANDFLGMAKVRASRDTATWLSVGGIPSYGSIGRSASCLATMWPGKAFSYQHALKPYQAIADYVANEPLSRLLRQLVHPDLGDGAVPSSIGGFRQTFFVVLGDRLPHWATTHLFAHETMEGDEQPGHDRPGVTRRGPDPGRRFGRQQGTTELRHIPLLSPPGAGVLAPPYDSSSRDA